MNRPREPGRKIPRKCLANGHRAPRGSSSRELARSHTAVNSRPWARWLGPSVPYRELRRFAGTQLYTGLVRRDSKRAQRIAASTGAPLRQLEAWSQPSGGIAFLSPEEGPDDEALAA